MKKENNLKGIVAMVTGGATGIGASIVEVLAKDGASVACCYNKSKDSALKLQKKIKKIGYDIYTIKVDVTKSSEIENSVNLIMRYFSCPIGILINAAGDIIKSVDKYLQFKFIDPLNNNFLLQIPLILATGNY